MTYIKVNDTLYSATINGRVNDTAWDNRESKSITLSLTYAEVLALLPDNTHWSIVQKEDVPTYDENGNPVLDSEGNPVMEEQTTEWDNSEYSISGTVTDNRDGTVTIKMGKPTEIETLSTQLANAVTETELSTAYQEGVNSL